MRRRRFLTTAGVTGAGLLAGCTRGGDGGGDGGDGGGGGGGGGGSDGGGGGGGGGGTTQTTARSGELTPLKIGDPEALTGPYSTGAKQAQEGALLGAQVLRDDPEFERDVEILTDDTELNPSKAVEVTRRMIAEDEIQVFIGTTSSSSGLAVSPLLEKNKVIYISAQATDKLRGEQCHFYQYQIYTTSKSSILGILPMVFNEDLGKKWYTIAADYAFGRDQETALKEAASARDDVTYTGNDFTPFGHSNYGTNFAKVRDADPDVLFLCHWGGDTATATKQAVAEGLHQEMNIVVPLWIDFAAVQLSPESLQHLYGGVSWTNRLENEATSKFIDLFTQEFDQQPSETHQLGYKSVLLAGAAAKRAGSVNTDEMSSVLETTPFGELMSEVTLHGDPQERFRTEDHVNRKPYYQVRGKGPDQERAGRWDAFNLVGTTGPDHLPEVLSSCQMNRP